MEQLENVGLCSYVYADTESDTMENEIQMHKKGNGEKKRFFFSSQRKSLYELTFTNECLSWAKRKKNPFFFNDFHARHKTPNIFFFEFFAGFSCVMCNW